MRPTRAIASLILDLRGRKVMIDADLAEVYGVATKVLNQAVARNQDRFPLDFVFQLTPKETSFGVHTVFGIIAMREHRPAEEKPLYWVGSAKKDLLEFPEAVVDDIGYALGVVQYGGHPPSAKPWKGLGPGVSEIVEDDGSGTYRAVYTVRFRKAVYVLHAFQKKSPSGVRTARTDVRLIDERLDTAREDYEQRYGKEKN